MTTEQIIQTIGFVTPMMTAFYCSLLMVIAAIRDKNKDSRNLSLRMAGTLLVAMLTWMGLGSFALAPQVFIEVHSAFYWVLLMTQLLIYHNVFRLTAVRQDERFSVIHYLIPILLCGSLAVWSLFVPAEIRMAITERREFPVFYQTYATLYTSKVPVFLAYNLFYSFRGFRRIRKYKQALTDYSADDYHSSVRWLYLIFILSLATVPLALGLFVPIAFVRSLSSFLPILLNILEQILLAYNLFAVNYVLIYPSNEDEEIKQGMSDKKEPEAIGIAANVLDKATFEQYIRESKPYLVPGLRITHMIQPLKTNRTYLSIFINHEYGYNFSQFINHCRLLEYERLRNDPEHVHLSTLELLHASGFNHYRSYQRARKELMPLWKDQIKIFPVNDR